MTDDPSLTAQVEAQEIDAYSRLRAGTANIAPPVYWAVLYFAADAWHGVGLWRTNDAAIDKALTWERAGYAVMILPLTLEPGQTVDPSSPAP